MTEIIPHYIRRERYSNVTGNQTLEVWDNKTYPITIERVFTISQLNIPDVENIQIRGKHAHRDCTQILYQATGTSRVMTETKDSKNSFELSIHTPGLRIPPKTWVEIELKQSPSVLLVICDQKYDPDDYIYDKEELWKL